MSAKELVPPGYRFVLVPVRRLASRRPRRVQVCWRLALQKWTGKGWRFTRWRLYACATGHYQYCKRGDKTRNLRIEATSCAEVMSPGQCCDRKEICEDILLGRVMETITNLWSRVDDEVYFECFGCFDVAPDAVGYHVSDEDMTICKYDRCDIVWRIKLTDCSFTRERT